MKNIYYCLDCDQRSTRRWNLQTHIKRRHGAIGRPIPTIPKVPLQSPDKPVSNNWLGDFPPNNVFPATNNHPPDSEREIIETLRMFKEIYELRSILAPGLNVAPPMNVYFSNWGTVLGYNGYICKKCLSYEIKYIFDDTERISLKPNHTCNQQRLYEAQLVNDIPGTIRKRRQELIFYLTLMVNDMTKQQDLVNLTAVELTASVFDIRLNNYEEYIDLDSLESVTLDWAYRAAKERKTMINRIDLQEFLGIFEATMGFFRLTIDGVKRYFFVYITKGLEPWDVKYLKRFLNTDSPTTNIANQNPKQPTESELPTSLPGLLKGVNPGRPVNLTGASPGVPPNIAGPSPAGPTNKTIPAPTQTNKSKPDPSPSTTTQPTNTPPFNNSNPNPPPTQQNTTTAITPPPPPFASNPTPNNITSSRPKTSENNTTPTLSTPSNQQTTTQGCRQGTDNSTCRSNPNPPPTQQNTTTNPAVDCNPNPNDRSCSQQNIKNNPSPDIGNENNSNSGSDPGGSSSGSAVYLLLESLIAKTNKPSQIRSA